MGRPSATLRRHAVPAVCGLLLLAVALSFGQTIRHEFINFDDKDYVYDNPQVARGFTPQGIAGAFEHFQFGNWHPLTWLSHMLDCQLYGLAWPGGHHLTNVLLHAASAVLLLLVLWQMSGALWPGALAATLFAIHPLHVESVAWVAERKDVLSGLFFMLALAAYTCYARRPFSLLRYLLVTALFALGLMAKPMLVTLPLVLLLLDYWPLGRAGSRERGTRGPESRPVPAEICDLKSEICNPRPVPRRPPRITWAWLIVEKLPWLALAAVSCVVTYWAQGTAIMPFQHLPLGSRIANALVSYVAYSGQFFYPVGLAVFYPLPQNALPAWKIVGCGLLLAGISLAVLVCRRKCPYLLVGWLWYLGMLVPVIGLVQVGSQAMADRYTYLTQIGLYIALAWGAERVSRDCAYRQRVAAVTSALAVTSLTCCAWQQVSYWKDGEAVWTHTLACTSKNHLAHGALAIVLAEHGRVDEAIAHYRTALRIKPDWELAHYNLGLALAGRGQIDEAIAHYRMAWKIKPDYVEALNNMAWIRATHPDPKFRDGPEAVRLACRVIELSSSNAAALDTLAAAYAEAGRFAEAVRTAREALDLSAQQNQQALAESLQAKLRLYEARTPFRESPSAIQP